MSLKHAFDGVVYAMRVEQNFRFDIAAALYVIWFSAAYGLSRIEWAVILITIGIMLVAEAVNTAVEQAVDASVRGYEIHAKNAKDAAAGAALIFAVISTAVAIVIFFDLKRLYGAFVRIINSYALIASFLIITLFVIWLFVKFKKK